MTQLTLRDYVSQNRTPAKILCIYRKVFYYPIPLFYASLPDADDFVVDHVERDLLSADNDVVYVRVRTDLKVG